MIDFDKIAKDADESFPALIGRIQMLHEQGKLKTFVAIICEDEGDGVDGLSYWTPPGTSYFEAVGAAEWLRSAIDCYECYHGVSED